MYRLVRIEGFHDFHVGSKLKFVLYDGSEYKSYNAHVSNNFITIEYISMITPSTVSYADNEKNTFLKQKSLSTFIDNLNLNLLNCFHQ